MYNVTVKTRNSPPIVIEVEYMNDIVFREHFLTLHKNLCRYNFSKSDIEYYFIERIKINE